MKDSQVFYWTLFFLMMFSSPVQAADITATLDGAAKSKIYGQPSCTTNEKITFTWTFTLAGATVVPSAENKYYILLGGSDPKTAVILQEGKLNINSSGTGGAQDPSGVFNGSPENEDKSKGMFEDTALTVRDIIGHHATLNQQPIPDLKTVCNTAAAKEGSVELYYVGEFQTVDQTGGGNSKKTVEGTLTINYDLSPPAAPAAPTLSPSEKSLLVSWKAEKNTSYDIYYREGTGFTPEKALEEAQKANTTGAVSSSSFSIKNLSNGKTYYISIRAIDQAGNAGSFSPNASGKPLELNDFYETYRKAGGTDQGFDGGAYCFIATAAYGSYDHKYVQILRDFRDQYLLTNRPGKAFVSWYYKTSPSWAKWVEKSPKAKRVTQVLLLPLIGMSLFLVKLPLWLQFFSFLGFLLLILAWRRRRKSHLIVGALLFMFAFSAQTQTVHAQEATGESPRNFGFEIRIGPYRPDIDLSPGLSKGSNPYSNFFGESSQLYLETSFEWLLLKKYGSLGLAASIGVSWATAEAQKQTQPLVTHQADTSSETIQNTSSLYIIPLRLDLVYRFDYFTRRSRFPFVPYVRGGLDYSLWFVTAPDGSISSHTDKNKTYSAFGARLGYHAGIGLQLLLDVLDPETAKNFDVESGVNHTYLFVEWNVSWIGVITDGIDLSDSNIRAGLMFQF